MWAVLQCEVYMHMFNYTIVHDIKGLTHSLISHYLVYNWNKVLSWGTVYCCTIHCTCTTHTMHMYTVDCVHDQNVTIHNVSLMLYYLILWIINYICITIGSYLSIPVTAVISGLHANKVEGPILLCIDHFTLFVCTF